MCIHLQCHLSSVVLFFGGGIRRFPARKTSGRPLKDASVWSHPNGTPNSLKSLRSRAVLFISFWRGASGHCLSVRGGEPQTPGCGSELLTRFMNGKARCLLQTWFLSRSLAHFWLLSTFVLKHGREPCFFFPFFFLSIWSLHHERFRFAFWVALDDTLALATSWGTPVSSVYRRTCRAAWRVMRSAVGNDPTSLIMSEKVYLLTTYNVCDFVHLSVAVTESDKTTKQTSTTIIRWNQFLSNFVSYSFGKCRFLGGSKFDASRLRFC